MSTHDESNDTSRRGLRRREALAAAGSLGLGGLLGATRLAGGSGEAEAQAASCVLTPEVTEGPYWIENELTRRDIRAGRAASRSRSSSRSRTRRRAR
jgi:hypothetical protein